MLDSDEARRVNMAEVLDHSWLNQRLPPALANRLAEVKTAQARLEAAPDAYSVKAGDAVISTFVSDALSRAGGMRRKVREDVHQPTSVAYFLRRGGGVGCTAAREQAAALQQGARGEAGHSAVGAAELSAGSHPISRSVLKLLLVSARLRSPLSSVQSADGLGDDRVVSSLLLGRERKHRHGPGGTGTGRTSTGEGESTHQSVHGRASVSRTSLGGCSVGHARSSLGASSSPSHGVSIGDVPVDGSYHNGTAGPPGLMHASPSPQPHGKPGRIICSPGIETGTVGAMDNGWGTRLAGRGGGGGA